MKRNQPKNKKSRKTKGGVGAAHPRTGAKAKRKPGPNWQAAEDVFQKGMELLNDGQKQEAEAAFREAVKIEPTHVPARGYLGITLKDRGEWESALEHFNYVLKVEPDNGMANINVGTYYALKDDNDTAEKYYLRVAENKNDTQPDHYISDAYVNLANLCIRTKRAKMAGQYYYASLHYNPTSFYALLGLAGWLTAENRSEEALALLKHLDKGNPGDERLVAHIGQALLHARKHHEALSYLKKAHELEPHDFTIVHNLYGVYFSLGMRQEAEEAIQKAIVMAPNNTDLWDSRIFNADFSPTLTVKQMSALRREYNERFIRPLAPRRRPHRNDPDPDRKLRIGYVSADFRRHSASHIFMPPIIERDETQFDAICYANSTVEDMVTKNIQKFATDWRWVQNFTDNELAEQVRKDKIDILIDLSGHSGGNRLITFGLKPAPVQASAFGYATGTGCEAMDYLLADECTIPPEEEKYYLEEIARIPAPIVYKPFKGLPNIKPLPALRNGAITFGCYNRASRISVETVALWSVILNAIPKSRLVFKGAFDTPASREIIIKGMQENGVNLDRIWFLPQTPWVQHMESIGDLDIMLDPVPHGGGISVTDPIWMGVPVVTLKGHVMTHRIGAGILHGAGLDDWIANSPKEYIEIIKTKIQDLDALAKLRAEMRTKVEATPLGNTGLYVRHVEGIYRTCWRRWCEQQNRQA